MAEDEVAEGEMLDRQAEVRLALQAQQFSHDRRDELRLADRFAGHGHV
jgi:hypothetical protein